MSTIFDIFSGYSLLAYHPSACNCHTCIDISGNESQVDGRLINGLCVRLESFSQSLLNLGGCPILYPLIDLFQEADYNEVNNVISSDDDDDENSTTKSSLDYRTSSFSNPIALIIHLLNYILSSTSITMLTEQMTDHYNVEILATYLNHISPIFIDRQLLISIEQIIELSQSINLSNVFTTKVIQYILLNFNIWSKSTYHVRMLHLKYVTKLVQYETIFNREKFGVEFFLDVLKEHFK